jgi:phosphodiesterase/alkaline phosphatase D-like protein
MSALHASRVVPPWVIMILTLGGSLCWSGSVVASPPIPDSQILPPAKQSDRVRITEGPTIELAKPSLIIIKWTSNNPGGTDEHFGVIHYGTDPEHLSQVAKSPVRLNQNHASTVFRVRVDGLKPQTTYYYSVDSMQGNGKSDGVNSGVNHFTSP